jgi:hypothetical protein
MNDAPRLRHSVRVLLLDEEDRLLLFRVDHPETGGALWFPPGGGLEDGEDVRAAAVREVAEVAHFEPDGAGMTEMEKADLTECRWWTLDELEAATDELVPRDLAARLRALLVDGPPARPIDVGI